MPYRGYLEFHWQHIDAFESRDVQKHAAPHDRRHRIHTELRHPVLVGVFHFTASVKNTVAGKMTQRIDVRASVSA